jgi:SAM-dependent methyltransferase
MKQKNMHGTSEMTNKKFHMQCPVCSSSNLTRRFDVGEFKIDRCGTCGLVFVTNMISPSELANHYHGTGDMEETVYGDDNTDCLVYYYKELQAELSMLIHEPGAILDIGCSSGSFLDVMTGWERHGCEICEPLGQKAKSKYGDNIFIGSISDYNIRECYFDIITMQDVLDHCPDPVAVLKKCRLMLKPDGVIVVKVHNISCLYAKLSGKNFYAITPPIHLFYFDKRSLSIALEKAGFKPMKFKFMPHILKLQTIFLRLSRGGDNLFFSIFKALKNTFAGNLKIRKNLNDIITVFAKQNDIGL